MRCIHLLLLGCILLGASCTRGAGLSRQGIPEPALESQSLPDRLAIPFPDDSRELSAVPLRLEVVGRDTYDRSGLAGDDNDDLLLPAMQGQLSYGMYRLHPGRFTFTEIGFELQDTTRPEGIWIGVADYFTHRWRWTQYTAGMATLDCSGIAQVGPAGNTYMAILAHDDTLTRVKRCYVDLEVPAWNGYEIDSSNTPGVRNAMARFGNMLGILYEAGDGLGGQELRFATHIPLIPTQPSDWTVTDVYGGYLDPVIDIDLESIGNNPGMAMQIPDAVPGSTDLWYAYSSTSNPADASAWKWTSVGVGVDSDGMDLTVVNGNPVLAYEANEGGPGNTVRCAFSSRPDPQISPDWVNIVAWQDPGLNGDYSSINVYPLVSGLALLFYNAANQHLEHGYYEGVIPPAGPSEFTVGDVDTEPLLGQLNAGIGFQLASSCLYTDPVTGVLLYAHGSKTGPLSPADFQHQHVVDESTVGESLAVINLQSGMGVVYREMDGSSVRFAWTEGFPVNSGNDWYILTVDERPTLGDISVSYLQDGRPCVCYHTINPPALQFSVMVP
ncbi:MAG: hypothetical protein R3F46_07620 [bacterium]